MKPTLLVSLAMVLVTGGCILDPGSSGPPPPDDCSSPRALEGIESVELGLMDDTQGVFVPFEDYDSVPKIYGPQGGAMIGAAVLVRGTDLPGCMQHSLEAVLPGIGVVAASNYPVATYPSVEGTRITRPIWLVFDFEEPQPGEAIELVLRLGGFEVRRTVVVDGSPLQ
jgi:hypothetical protein